MNTRVKEIDFVKGVAIVSVLMLHTLPENVLVTTYAQLHIGQAVPLFLFITCYLSFKGLQLKDKGNSGIILSYYSIRRIKRVLMEVALPFFLVASLQFLIHIFYDGISFSISGYLHALKGEGPGNYYFWVYLQLWLIIPFVFILLKKTDLVGGAILILIASILLNVGCDRLSISSGYYRLLSVRYLFLTVPAFILFNITNKYKERDCTFFPAYVNIGIIISFVYLTFFIRIDLAPYILDLGWAGQQWPAYFWTYPVILLLIMYGRKLSNTNIARVFEVLGYNSWYIFLGQMFILSFVEVDFLDFIDNYFVRIICFILLISTFSILSALTINIIKNSFHAK